ncbi:MAG: NAD(P)H-hydrate dehydratase [Caldilineales bacterium]
MKIVTVAQMVQIEQASDAAGHSYDAMMELAGRAVAAALLRHMQPWDSNGAVLVLVGPGNNGGDGLVAARYLHRWDKQRALRVYCWKRTPGDDPNYAALQKRGIPVVHAEDDPDFGQLANMLRDADVVIDALLGTGVSRPIGGSLAELLAVVHRAKAVDDRRGANGNTVSEQADLSPESAARALHPAADYRFLNQAPESTRPLPQVIAVDCPSGLNCDSGALDPAALPADLTVTFANPKIGHFVGEGPGACGRLEIADIGTDPGLARAVPLELVTPAAMRRLLPVRPADAHKGTFGKALVVAGSVNYTGAAHLSCAAAYRSGAGLVTAGVTPSIYPVLAAGLAETTWLMLPEHHGTLSSRAAQTLSESLAGYAALLVGPGLTHEAEPVRFVQEFLSAAVDIPLVLDADALNALARADGWYETLPERVILTPHPGEMARLCGCTTAQVGADRIGLARRKAGEWNAVVLLKGAHTVVAHPDGRATVLPFANPALATAGSGDVLSGVIVGLLSQGLAPYDAAVLGGYLHGLAGELARGDLGEAGVVAGDLVTRLPLAIRRLRAA